MCVCVCVRVRACVCVCVRVYCIFFIHLSADGQLGCLHMLPVVNSAAVNIGIHVSFQISDFFFFLNIYPRVELLDHMLILVF